MKQCVSIELFYNELFFNRCYFFVIIIELLWIKQMTYEASL